MSVKQFELFRKSQLYNLRDELDKLDSQISALARSLYTAEAVVPFSRPLPSYLKPSSHTISYRVQQMNFLKLSFGLHPGNFACGFSIFYPIFH